jgi:23S rRNA pseudouridine1911/1915/1917 synthase
LQRSAAGTLCSVEIMTGRPHQIRIHLASVGHPLLGDPVYGSGGGILEAPGLPGDAGYILHAHRMKFRHPALGREISIEAPLPECLR